MRSNRAVVTIGVMTGFLVLWELACGLLQVPNYLLPPPSEILLELWSDPLWYLSECGYTVLTTTAGFGLAVVVGVVCAIGITSSKLIDNTLFTLLVSLNSVPKIALAPLFIIWLGTGVASKVAVSFLIAVFAIVVDTVLGLRSADPGAIDLMRTMRGSPFQILMKIQLPNALPYMFAAMKVAVAFALVGAVAGEFVASQHGLGYVILSAQSMFQTTRVFAAILLLGIVGTLLFGLIGLIERMVCPWHVSHRVDAGAATARG